MNNHSAPSTDPLSQAPPNTKDEIARCDREIARIETEARNGNPDVYGIVRGLTDWRTEKALIEKESQ